MSAQFTKEWYDALSDRMKVKVRKADAVLCDALKSESAAFPKPTKKPKKVKQPKADRCKLLQAWNAALNLDPDIPSVSQHPGFRPESEYSGIPGRKFRFDYAWPTFKFALEIDGGIWLKKGGHTTGTGKSRDMNKDWLAIQNGWIVLRWSPQMITVTNCQLLLERLKILI